MRDIKNLETKATSIRKSIVKMICEAKSGHPGGSLSATDILTALYFAEMNIDPANPKMENIEIINSAWGGIEYRIYLSNILSDILRVLPLYAIR